VYALCARDLIDPDITFIENDTLRLTTTVVSPNGDGINDEVLFIFRADVGTSPRVEIFDLRGRQLRDLSNDIQHEGRIVRVRLDGRDGSGNDLSPGAYIYQAKTDTFKFNGVILIAR